jgi:hypothetical protein
MFLKIVQTIGSRQVPGRLLVCVLVKKLEAARWTSGPVRARVSGYRAAYGVFNATGVGNTLSAARGTRASTPPRRKGPTADSGSEFQGPGVTVGWVVCRFGLLLINETALQRPRGVPSGAFATWAIQGRSGKPALARGQLTADPPAAGPSRTSLSSASASLRRAGGKPPGGLKWPRWPRASLSGGPCGHQRPSPHCAVALAGQVLRLIGRD